MNEIICDCINLSKDELVELIEEKDLKTLDEIMDNTDAGITCKSCRNDLLTCLKRG